MNAKVEMNAGARAKLLCAAVASAAVLSACGGGGGSTDMANQMTPSGTTPPQAAPPADTPPANFAAALTRTAKDIHDVVAEAARSQPSFGSVTQSSNSEGGATTDHVAIEADLGSDGIVTYTLAGTLGGESLELEARGGEQARSSEYQDELRSARSIGGSPGALYVRTITNFEDRAASAANTNYLSAGYWAFLPDDRTSPNLSFGAFADGTNSFESGNMAGLIGGASYEGGAGGVFVVGAGEETSISPFEATASLTAEFGDGSSLGSISGRIYDVEDSEGNRLDRSPMVTLQSADIRGEDSGSFTGATTMTFGDDDATYDGSWGGHFLGNGAAPTNHPLGVVGTFGATTVEGETPTRSLVGAFYARKEESP